MKSQAPAPTSSGFQPFARNLRISVSRPIAASATVRRKVVVWTVRHEHASEGGGVVCTRDEGRPLDAGGQARASNHCKLLSSKAMVVSVAAKGGTRARQV